MDNSKNPILLISDDKFILGLLKGYGLANQLDINTKSALEKIDQNDKKYNYKLIIFDIRHLDRAFTKEQLKALKTIHNNKKTPICAISHDTNNKDSQDESWVDLYLENPIMEKLDSYLREHFNYNFHPFPDRRNNDRRHNKRRSEDSHKYLTTDSPINNSENHDLTQHVHFENYKVGPFTVNISSQSVYFKEKNLKLTRKEFKLFSLLAADTEHVFSSQEIINHLWKENGRANKSDLYQYMHLLRKKIEIDPYNPHWVLTLKGIGYKLNTQPLYDVNQKEAESKDININHILQ
ncbi:winged helix-turn-helix domain-containing protein [Neptunomonas japonica]|uniref:winged helix-turn-helix domain-containing protein n=1 Tax=Neptunomonas japonica TaxID=417574 RepID=UPI0003F76BDD|nr:winged helix-turn-helix domain-containing protein [Neptunomonas japonica]